MRVPGQTKLRARGPAASLASEMPLLPGEHLGREYREGEWTEPVGLIERSSVMMVPTLLMASLMQSARESNLPKAAPLELERRLMPGKIHQIAKVCEVYESVGKTGGGLKINQWVRGRVRLCLDDDPEAKMGYEEWFDFDAARIGNLIELSSKRERSVAAGVPPGGVPPGFRGLVGVPTPPRWVGTHAFEPIFRLTAEEATKYKLQPSQKTIKARQAMAISEATNLSDAHVLRMDPEQVAVLPEWEDPQEVFDYAEEAVLPFDPLFLDFTGAGGIAPRVGSWYGDASPLVMKGALVWRQSPMGLPGVPTSEVLMVAPYGWPDRASERWAGLPEAGPGWFVFGMRPHDAETGELVPAGQVQLFVQGTPFYGVSATVWADACADSDPKLQRGLPGYAMLPFDKASARREARDTVELAEVLFVWGAMIYSLAAKALAALSVTEAVEVEIVDAPVERRDRKRAEKRNWPIAQQVVIRSHSRRYRDVPATRGEEAHYSHRFWRRATTAHYPLGTRVADARPDLVTACHRPPESNCGFCRKVKRVACIVGPEDKPLVLKTLTKQKT